MHGFKQICGVKVTSAVSETGGFTPSSTVSVAANTPMLVQTNVVVTAFGVPNEQFGLPFDH
jgi:hypothetical protein